jgi:hypothetical protein
MFIARYRSFATLQFSVATMLNPADATFFRVDMAKYQSVRQTL